MRLDFCKQGSLVKYTQGKLWERWKSLFAAGLFRAFTGYQALQLFLEMPEYVAVLRCTGSQNSFLMDWALKSREVEF